ncbi:hypothetical protein OIU34_20505 [Pararhizobium sp. BT-229]|uniref:hypothetical protein n=1 Tax=Pararhizobium sp. BT-229 TaxID=2986923 RepID=UPI0021F761A5|nr:hypothetical protein [Pararhizobium sp. BT-229]MCV9964271.1 hypothetical protein [Pararhizobium sp. BT-229]
MSGTASDTTETEVALLYERHASAARTSLKIAQCFSAMRDFEKKVRALNGVSSFRFEVGRKPEVLEAGIIKLQFRPDAVPRVVGHWTVDRNGVGQIDFLDIPVLSGLGSSLGTELRRLFSDGRLTRVLNAAAASDRGEGSPAAR